MGRVLAQAINDDAVIDDSAAMLQALAVLDSPHFSLLAKIANLELSDLGGGFGVPEPYKSALIAQGVVTGSTRGVGLIGFTVDRTSASDIKPAIAATSSRPRPRCHGANRPQFGQDVAAGSPQRAGGCLKRHLDPLERSCKVRPRVRRCVSLLNLGLLGGSADLPESLRKAEVQVRAVWAAGAFVPSPPSDTRLYPNICEGCDRGVDDFLAGVVLDL
jgi:hypothetical protein